MGCSVLYDPSFSGVMEPSSFCVQHWQVESSTGSSAACSCVRSRQTMLRPCDFLVLRFCKDSQFSCESLISGVLSRSTCRAHVLSVTLPAGLRGSILFRIWSFPGLPRQSSVAPRRWDDSVGSWTLGRLLDSQRRPRRQEGRFDPDPTLFYLRYSCVR